MARKKKEVCTMQNKPQDKPPKPKAYSEPRRAESRMQEQGELGAGLRGEAELGPQSGLSASRQRETGTLLAISTSKGPEAREPNLGVERGYIQHCPIEPSATMETLYICTIQCDSYQPPVTTEELKCGRCN